MPAPSGPRGGYDHGAQGEGGPRPSAQICTFEGDSTNLATEHDSPEPQYQDRKALLIEYKVD